MTELLHFHFHFHALEKEMAAHSSVLAWGIPGTGEPGGLPSLGSQSRTRLKRLSSSRTTVHQASLSFTVSLSLLRLTYTESVMPSDHLILCHPLLLPSIFSSIRDFSNESVRLIRGPKYWGFSISLSNEYSGLISFKIDWFSTFK